MQLKIYYIDDEELLCENFADHFESDKVVVTTFTDTQVAVAAIKKSPPDLLFIDFRMPGTTGDEIAKIIDPKIPKFLITGDLSVDPEYTFDKIFPKPYDESKIFELINFYLSQKISC